MSEEININEEIRTKKPYRFRGNLAVKIMAGILLVIMCFTALVSAFGVFILGEDGAYKNRYEPNFYESALCGWAVDSHVYYDLAPELHNPKDFEASLKDPQSAFHPDNTNIMFVAEYFFQGTKERNYPPYYTIQNYDVETVSGYYYMETSVPSAIAGTDSWDTVGLKVYLRNPLINTVEGFLPVSRIYDFLTSNVTLITITLIASTLCAVALFIFLLCSAGRKSGLEGVYLNWFDRIPLDVLAAVFGLAIFLLLEVTMYSNFYYLSYPYVYYVEPIVLLLASGILLLSFSMSLAGRIKAGRFLENTILNMWVWESVKKAAKWVILLFCKAIALLPLIWRVVLIFIVLGIVNIIFMSYIAYGNAGLLILLAFIDFAFLVGIGWICYQMKLLKDAGAELAKGNLSYKTDTTGLIWELKEHGENLNSISEGMSRAVDERMKSEQFKTELITNVSHDIKTPLTSIINYVDLLKKGEGDSEKSTEYLEVLDRQSARLKKLTEDLVEASKATSGVLKVDKSVNDICELLRQALGEYKDRLAQRDVNVIVREAEKEVNITCDGRLMWRVFDNLLGNICKYSQPGTRAYVDIDRDGERAWVIFKNTSQDVLNITADELMERFVRGDKSRTSEGSGLGLSIARSLIELQGGTFSIYLDGDLFKVIISLPFEN